MNAFSIYLLAVLLLPLAAAGNKAEAAAPVGAGKQLTSEEEFAYTKKKAAAGDVDAQYNLGVRYANGEGVPKDAAKAVEWYQKAAAQGDAGAQYNLGVMYAKGKGVPKNAAKAAEWFQKTAAQGDANAQSRLGWMYNNGEGVHKDAAKAMEWFRRLLNKGMPMLNTTSA